MRTLFIDTETTGLIRNHLRPLSQQPRVIELFGLLMEQKEKGQVPVEINTWSWMFKQDSPLPEKITKITGITDNMLKGHLSFQHLAHEVLMMIDTADAIVAHNATFDKDMIEMEFQRLNVRAAWPTIYCTVEQTEYIKGRRLHLSELYEMLFGESFSGAHRAEQDVRALAACYYELLLRGAIHDPVGTFAAPNLAGD